MAELPALLTLTEVADLFRATAKNRSRAGRAIADRHRLPLIEGHRPGIYLVPRHAIEQLIGTPTVCPTCGRDIDPAVGCPTHPPARLLERAS